MNKILKAVLFGFIVIAIMISVHYVNWLRPVENFFINISSPIQSRAYNFSMGIKSFYDSWLKKKDLLAENTNLESELKLYKTDQAYIKGLEEENELLKKELNFTKEKKANFVSAQIISGVSDPVSRSVIINKGNRDGITKGMAVVADRGIMVGKIDDVYEDFSKVLLLTDNKSRVAVTIQNVDRTIGLVEGQFGLSFSMTNIPQNQDVKKDDFVVTSGLEGLIPKNLLIAQVDNVNRIESEIFKTATLRPIIPFADLSYVLVIIPQ